LVRLVGAFVARVIFVSKVRSAFGAELPMHKNTFRFFKKMERPAACVRIVVCDENETEELQKTIHENAQSFMDIVRCVICDTPDLTMPVCASGEHYMCISCYAHSVMQYDFAALNMLHFKCRARVKPSVLDDGCPMCQDAVLVPVPRTQQALFTLMDKPLAECPAFRRRDEFVDWDAADKMGVRTTKQMMMQWPRFVRSSIKCDCGDTLYFEHSQSPILDRAECGHVTCAVYTNAHPSQIMHSPAVAALQTHLNTCKSVSTFCLGECNAHIKMADRQLHAQMHSTVKTTQRAISACFSDPNPNM
jgi:hypothetical protein